MGYRESVEQGLKEYEAGNFDESRALFGKAHALFPNARTHRGIGVVEFELRHYRDSAAHLHAALQSTERPLDDRLRSETEALLARARGFLAELRVETRPPARRLLLDGLPLESGRGQSLVVQVGEHTLEAETDGYAPEKRRISVKGGERLEVAIVFGRPFASTLRAPEEARAATARSGTAARTHWYRRPWLWVVAGVVVAGAATGGALAARAGGSVQTIAPTGGSTDVVIVGPPRAP